MSPAFRSLLLVMLPIMIMQAQQNRVPVRIEGSARTTLTVATPAEARRAMDRGAVAPSLAIPSMTLTLKRSASQQKAIEPLLNEQQDPTSANYHRWLTPEEYADRFGVNQNDIARLSGWLKSQGFTVQSVSRGRMWIVFSGTADQVQSTFHTEIHRLVVDRVEHYANASSPSIPAGLAEIVGGIQNLNDFLPKPAALRTYPKANFTLGPQHGLSPEDIATIYNITPLYNAGVDGTGQKIVVAGATDIDVADIQAFRSRFNLAPRDPQKILVPNYPDPGTTAGDLLEADVDVEWAGAVARGATVIYVYSRSPFTAVQYAIDQNLAPVITVSYTLGCEAANIGNENFFQALAQQANAQGITWIESSGDTGGAACDENGATIAQNGLSVHFPSSIPEITAVGGTSFSEGSGNYWKTTNTANGGSALSYIPEMAWNESAIPRLSIVPLTQFAMSASGGGASSVFTKPVWQSGPGVPNDGHRDIPDLAMAASPLHDGYLFSSGNDVGTVGGTSVSAPVFAGVTALLNQYLLATGSLVVPGMANLNPAIYRLGPVPTIFHDVVQGGNAVHCAAGTPDCTNGSLGYAAGVGYDLATGWGSMDVNNLVHLWLSRPASGSQVVLSVFPNPAYQKAPDANGFTWATRIALSEEAGIGTTITNLNIGGTDYTAQIVNFFGSANVPPSGNVDVTLGTRNLSPPVTRTVSMSGIDATGQTWTRQVAVQYLGPAPTLAVTGAGNAASGQQQYAPGMIMSVYGANFSTATQAAAATPLSLFTAGFRAFINGVQAPLYFVSPGQVNLQIPYETDPGKATLNVYTGNQSASFSFQVQAAAPGIFASNGAAVPYSSGSQGQTLILFVTGEGQVTPSLATGTSPAISTPYQKLPGPQLPVTLTVGGVPATIVFQGIPSGLVGATQINFVVPQTAPIGVQPVVVTIGGVVSTAVNLTVTQ